MYVIRARFKFKQGCTHLRSPRPHQGTDMSITRKSSVVPLCRRFSPFQPPGRQVAHFSHCRLVIPVLSMQVEPGTTVRCPSAFVQQPVRGPASLHTSASHSFVPVAECCSVACTCYLSPCSWATRDRAALAPQIQTSSVWTHALVALG